MQLFTQDKAIEFNSLKSKVENTLENLRRIRINVSSEEQTLSTICASCEAITNGSTQFQAEDIYKNGIDKLNELLEALNNHEVYYISYVCAIDIESSLNQKTLTEQEIQTLSQKVIDLVNQINQSDTRFYADESFVVDKIYDVAYAMIKLELLLFGKSTILDWIKKYGDQAIGLINQKIKTEANTLRDSNQNTNTDESISQIDEIIRKIESQSLTCDYLDEELIYYIGINDKATMKKVESYLSHLINEIEASDFKIKENEEKRNAIEAKIKELANHLRFSGFFKNFGILISLLAILAGLKYGGDKAINMVGVNKYKTKLDYYSSIGAEAPKYPEYMEKISGWQSTKLTAYDVWRQENIFYGNWKRTIVTYDLSNVDINAIEDILSMNFSTRTPNKVQETAENIDPNDLYNKAIIEIIRLVQDEKSETFVPNEEAQNILSIILASICSATALGIICVGIHDIMKKVQEYINAKQITKKEALELQNALSEYNELAKQNSAFKTLFANYYSQFSSVIQSDKIKAYYYLQRKQ